MKNLVAFFEIPAADFNRAVNFYESILKLKLNAIDCGVEKMAFFPSENELVPGAISFAPGFSPSGNGVLISLHVDDISSTLALVEKLGGKVIRPKTKIEAEGRGYFATFTDSEGNQLGLYADK